MTPEEYIKANTRACNCPIILGGKQEWITLEDALAAVKLAKEEMKAAVIKCEKKSPITGGEMQLMQEKSSVKFRGEEISFIKKFYHCVDSGQEFTDTELDNDNMWSIFRAYWERKGFEHFYDIDGYREEQESVSKDLEQVTERYACRYSSSKYGYAKVGEAFKVGAQWQREQMMKDAVDGWVARDKDCDIAIFREVPTKDAEIGMWKPCKSAYIFLNKDEYPDVTWDSEPQKVKVTIIKE